MREAECGAFIARAEAAEGRVEEIPIRLDTAAFDLDAMTLTLVWRGAAGVADERAPDLTALHLFTEDATTEGMTLAEARPIAWAGTVDRRRRDELDQGLAPEGDRAGGDVKTGAGDVEGRRIGHAPRLGLKRPVA